MRVSVCVDDALIDTYGHPLRRDTCGGTQIAGRRYPFFAAVVAQRGLQWKATGARTGRIAWTRPLRHGDRIPNAVDAVASVVATVRNVGPWSSSGLTIDVFNLLDRKVNDIQYFYESRVAGEAGPVPDRIVHPGEPRSLRVTLRLDL
jgi:hypothetical protein